MDLVGTLSYKPPTRVVSRRSSRSSARSWGSLRRPLSSAALGVAYQERSGAGRLAARLETLPDGCYSLSSDEQVERVISERLHRENIAKQEQSDQAALKRYQEGMADYKKKGFWDRRRHAAPEEPQPAPGPPPPSDDQIMGYRRKLIARISEIVVNLIETMFDIWDRLNPSPSSGVDRPAPLQAPGDQPQHDRSKSRVR